jgi:hypothetical protein
MIFSEKHELVRKLARDFAEKELTKDVLDQIEDTGEYPKELLDKMAKAGFFGIKTPVEYGGQGSDYLSYVITIEELARASAVTTIWASAPNSLGGGPLMLAGTPEQLEKYLKPVARGEKILAFGLTEPNAGSDAGGTTTTAVRDGDYWILNGRKTFITTAPVADWCIIYAKTDMTQKGSKGISAFIMDMKLPGVSCGKAEHKMGIIGCPTSDIIHGGRYACTRTTCSEKGKRLHERTMKYTRHRPHRRGRDVRRRGCRARWMSPYGMPRSANSSAAPSPSSRPSASCSPTWPRSSGRQGTRLPGRPAQGRRKQRGRHGRVDGQVLLN